MPPAKTFSEHGFGRTDTGTRIAHTHDALSERGRRRLLLVLCADGRLHAGRGGGRLVDGESGAAGRRRAHARGRGRARAGALAAWFGARPASPSKTYGYYRLEILAAFANGVALVLVSLFILYEAYGRWSRRPRSSAAGMLMAVAAGGLARQSRLRVGAARRPRARLERARRVAARPRRRARVGRRHRGGRARRLYGWYAADPLFSALIAVLIIWSSWRLIREATNVLFEGTPAHINLAAVEGAILDTAGVEDVHDLHVWTITSGREALSAHVIHARGVAQPELLRSLRAQAPRTVRRRPPDDPDGDRGFRGRDVPLLHLGHGLLPLDEGMRSRSEVRCSVERHLVLTDI